MEIIRQGRFKPPVIATVLLLSAHGVAAQVLQLDYRFPPPRWNTPIGLPGDWHKPMVDENGSLVYDFGPGPYAIPGTRIGFEVVNDSIGESSQTIVDPRVPIVVTESSGSHSSVKTETFSVLPHHDWEHDDRRYDGDVRRINGSTGMIAWADPPGDVDPAFRNVAYGTNRPIDYQIRVEPGGERTVALGLADPYREKDHWIKRVIELHVEGAEPHVIDVVDRVGQNRPAVATFSSRDEDGDGWLNIRVTAKRETVDANLFLNVIWVFAADEEPAEEALIRGDWSERAEYYVDCGRDLQFLARGPRMDLLHARFIGDSPEPALLVRTKRTLTFDSESGALMSFGVPFILTDPAPKSVEQINEGWTLLLPDGTLEAIAAVAHGGSDIERASLPDIAEEHERLAKYWHDEAGLPWDKITVSDTAIQALFDGSIRTMYQLTERVDGALQSQPGPSVYRGLWVSNQPRVGRALTHLGDFETVRSSLAQTFKFQEDDGQIVVLTPPTLLKETGIAMHALYHHARLTRDREFLESYWPALQRGAEWIEQARHETTDPEALNYELLPAGLSDGGVGGIIPEYTSVNWNLLAVKSLADGAQWLGRTKDAVRYEAQFSDFHAAFRRAAARDVRQEDHGNWFLPVRMEFDPDKHVPQRSQTQFSYMVYPGRLFDKDDPLVVGNMRMLADAPKEEGLVLSTGWLDGGVQPFIESTRAGVRVYLGQIETAQDAMYAIANHAAPTHVWIEEQMPGTGPRRATGDVPHSSASSEFVNMVRYFLAIEDGDHLDLLKGIPDKWIYPGALIQTDAIPTEFGELTMRLEISEDGSSAIVGVDAIASETDDGGSRIHLRALKSKGFTLPDGSELPDVWGGNWGKETVIRAVRAP